MKPGQWFMVDLFPGFNFSLHGSALSVSTITPLGPDEVMVEYRGLGLKSDNEAARNARAKHHNSIWSPFAIGGAAVTTADAGGEAPQEDALRQYYNEWGRWMKRIWIKPILRRHLILMQKIVTQQLAIMWLLLALAMQVSILPTKCAKAVLKGI
jgi:methanesulfonate monooxygenase large subunit